MFPYTKGLAWPRPMSDHIPLVLCGKLSNGDPKPFKFENMWIKSPNIANMVKGWWESFAISGKSGQRFRLKLKLLRS